MHYHFSSLKRGGKEKTNLTAMHLKTREKQSWAIFEAIQQSTSSLFQDISNTAKDLL